MGEMLYGGTYSLYREYSLYRDLDLLVEDDIGRLWLIKDRKPENNPDVETDVLDLLLGE